MSAASAADEDDFTTEVSSAAVAAGNGLNKLDLLPETGVRDGDLHMVIHEENFSSHQNKQHPTYQ